MRLSLRPATADDEPFLYRVYAATREQELAPLGWTETTKEAFLRSQYHAQDRSYKANNAQASFDVVLVDGIPAGRLYVDRHPSSIHVIDIALLAAHRGRGVGTRLLEAIFDEARASDRRVTINALRGSRAAALYQRLGFAVITEGEVYIDLEWTPAR